MARSKPYEKSVFRKASAISTPFWPNDKSAHGQNVAVVDNPALFGGEYAFAQSAIDSREFICHQADAHAGSAEQQAALKLLSATSLATRRPTS